MKPHQSRLGYSASCVKELTRTARKAFTVLVTPVMKEESLMGQRLSKMGSKLKNMEFQ